MQPIPSQPGQYGLVFCTAGSHELSSCLASWLALDTQTGTEKKAAVTPRIEKLIDPLPNMTFIQIATNMLAEPGAKGLKSSVVANFQASAIYIYIYIYTYYFKVKKYQYER